MTVLYKNSNRNSLIHVIVNPIKRNTLGVYLDLVIPSGSGFTRIHRCSITKKFNPLLAIFIQQLVDTPFPVFIKKPFEVLQTAGLFHNDKGHCCYLLANLASARRGALMERYSSAVSRRDIFSGFPFFTLHTSMSVRSRFKCHFSYCEGILSVIIQ